MKPAHYGIRIGTLPAGPTDSLADVAGVSVGHTTLMSGDGPLVRGSGPVRTGVTVIDPVPGDAWRSPVAAGFHRLNGKGDMSGIQWLVESGQLSTPIALTGTNALGTARQGLIRARAAVAESDEGNPSFSGHPVVGETNDSFLNDIAGFHVTEDHVAQALAAARAAKRPAAAERGTAAEAGSSAAVASPPAPFAEGAVGGGTGMICHEFKGGIGSASRLAETDAGAFTLGVLVQANHGTRERLAVNGAPVGRLLSGPRPVTGASAAEPHPHAPGEGSIIVVVATDAPLLPHQCRRIAERACMGIARTGGAGEYSSGDFSVAFSTTAPLAESTRYPTASPLRDAVEALTDRTLNPLYWAAIEATEAAIVSALLHAETMVGRDDNTVTGLDGAELADVLDRFGLRDLTAIGG